MAQQTIATETLAPETDSEALWTRFIEQRDRDGARISDHGGDRPVIVDNALGNLSFRCWRPGCGLHATAWHAHYGYLPPMTSA